jgi:hypothetical protein
LLTATPGFVLIPNERPRSWELIPSDSPRRAAQAPDGTQLNSFLKDTKTMKKKIIVCTLILTAILGGADQATISRATDLEFVYEAVLNQVKKDGFDVESASKDAGIKTSVVVTERYRQTGTYLEITFISEGGSQTTARITVFGEKRYKGLKTEPWSTPKVDQEKSHTEAATLKQELGW